MKPQAPSPPTPLRASIVEFDGLRDSANARNVLHDFSIDHGEGKMTRLKVEFERPSLEAHVIANWISSHPRIVLPILFFLLGGISYAVSITRQTSFWLY
jgi:hypothetical protein